MATKKIGIKLDGQYQYEDIGADIDDIDVYYKNGQIVPKDTAGASSQSAIVTLQKKQDQIQYETMPTTGKVGMIVQYIGNTTNTYQQGAYYKSKSNGSGGLAWDKIVTISVDNTVGGDPQKDTIPTSSAALYNTVQEMRSDFQDGVDTIYDACVAAGSTPAGSTPTAIAQAVSNLAEQTWETKIITSINFPAGGGGCKNYSLYSIYDATNLYSLQVPSDYDIEHGGWKVVFLRAGTIISIVSITSPSQQISIPSSAKTFRVEYSYNDSTFYEIGRYELVLEATYKTKVLR